MLARPAGWYLSVCLCTGWAQPRPIRPFGILSKLLLSVGRFVERIIFVNARFYIVNIGLVESDICVELLCIYYVAFKNCMLDL